ncbi:hypothetical protein R1sor_014848 [Riccia sorocarpa]|uniref:Uncharacterized protein n=1 Tax=Riccia sorocarpa TaxID=122646 RepID=A0ABD3HEE3_9MARC
MSGPGDTPYNTQASQGTQEPSQATQGPQGVPGSSNAVGLPMNLVTALGGNDNLVSLMQIKKTLLLRRKKMQTKIKNLEMRNETVRMMTMMSKKIGMEEQEEQDEDEDLPRPTEMLGVGLTLLKVQGLLKARKNGMFQTHNLPRILTIHLRRKNLLGNRPRRMLQMTQDVQLGPQGPKRLPNPQ